MSTSVTVTGESKEKYMKHMATIAVQQRVGGVIPKLLQHI